MIPAVGVDNITVIDNYISDVANYSDPGEDLDLEVLVFIQPGKSKGQGKNITLKGNVINCPDFRGAGSQDTRC